MSSRRRPDRAAASSSASSSSSEQAAAAAPLPPPPDPYQLLLEGKRFVCTECGKCCTGSGEVWANERECAAIAAHLGVTLAQFLARYTKAYSRRPGWRMLKLAQPSGDCIFLREGRHCSIYGARPLQCSSYPWWPELMDPAAWVAEGRAVCEGIEHESALPVDPAEKAPTLRAATAYFADQLVAKEAVRRRQEGAGGRRRGEDSGQR